MAFPRNPASSGHIGFPLDLLQKQGLFSQAPFLSCFMAKIDPKTLPADAVLVLIRGYQLLISPLIGPHCRHIPTCSQYAAEAVARFGVFKGGWLAARRVLRCHPWGTSGYDPVPEREDPPVSRKI